MKTLIIDNYDSYTFNLFQMIAEINGELPLVVPNDWAEVIDWRDPPWDNIVLSPGPGRPENERDFGICRQAVLHARVPLLGVCLGHQGIGQVFGGTIVHARAPMHGRASEIHHHGHALFAGIPSPFSAIRYHSLIVAGELPACLEATAWTDDGTIMGLRHRERPLFGVQFHPESICTEHGYRLLENFRDTTRGPRPRPRPQPQPRPQPRPQPQPSPSRDPVTSDAACDAPRHRSHGRWRVRSRRLDIYPDAERVFVHLFGASNDAFWLDSSLVDASRGSRFSFMGDGSGPHSLRVEYRVDDRALLVTHSDGRVSHARESIFDYLDRELAHRACPADGLPFDFNGGFVGYLGYELKAECGATLAHRAPLPDACLFLADRIIAFDHRDQSLYLVCLVADHDHDGDHGAHDHDDTRCDAWFAEVERRLRTLPVLDAVPSQPEDPPELAPAPVCFQLARSRSEYLADIDECLQQIHDGESYEICLTTHLTTRARPDPLAFYRTLRRRNPAPHAAYLRFADVAIICSSPERFLRIDRDGWVESKPIKGTRLRGRSAAEDDASRRALEQSVKDRAENLMIVDLLRNDLGAVCEIGSVHVPTLMAVESYATVHQLVSTVRGRLRADAHALDCIRAAFPGGSMTGAPKLRTMEIIDRLEGRARGVYSGTIGFLSLCGAADLNIVIRTAVSTAKGVSIGVGGAIIALSEPDAEFDEILLKANALVEALTSTLHGESSRARYRIED